MLGFTLETVRDFESGFGLDALSVRDIVGVRDRTGGLYVKSLVLRPVLGDTDRGARDSFRSSLVDRRTSDLFISEPFGGSTSSPRAMAKFIPHAIYVTYFPYKEFISSGVGLAS